MSDRDKINAALRGGVPQKADATGKAKSDFFTAVRTRGLVNAMLDAPAKAYEESHPGMKVRWEFSPPNGDQTMVTAREGIGYVLVDASDLPAGVVKRSGPVRVGDLVLMAAPEEIHNAIAEADAEAAQADLRLPETTYRDALESQKVQTMGGPVGATPIGSIQQRAEYLQQTAAEDNQA